MKILCKFSPCGEMFTYFTILSMVSLHLISAKSSSFVVSTSAIALTYSSTNSSMQTPRSSIPVSLSTRASKSLSEQVR